MTYDPFEKYDQWKTTDPALDDLHADCRHERSASADDACEAEYFAQAQAALDRRRDRDRDTRD